MRMIEVLGSGAMKSMAPSLLLFAAAAVAGYCVKPPELPFEDDIRLMDACFAACLAVAVWGLFHFIGLNRLNGTRVVASVAASVCIWALLFASVVAVLRAAEDQEQDRFFPQLTYERS